MPTWYWRRRPVTVARLGASLNFSRMAARSSLLVSVGACALKKSRNPGTPAQWPWPRCLGTGRSLRLLGAATDVGALARASRRLPIAGPSGRGGLALATAVVLPELLGLPNPGAIAVLGVVHHAE